VLGVTMESTGLASLDDEIVSSLYDVLEHMEGLIDYLMSKRRDDARWAGILSAMLVLFLGTVMVLIVNFITENSVTRFFVDHPGSSFIYLAFLSTCSVITGVIVYFLLRIKYVKPYVPWNKALSELRKATVEHELKDKSIVETAFQLMDRVNIWFSELVKYKNEEAFTYGLAAFLIAAFILAYSPLGLPVALLVGTGVWLYFRHEKREEAAQQIRKFKAWRKRMEEGKEALIKGIAEGRA